MQMTSTGGAVLLLWHVLSLAPQLLFKHPQNQVYEWQGTS